MSVRKRIRNGWPTFQSNALHLRCYAAFRTGPALATSRHDLAQRRQASAHFRIVGMSLYSSHSAAQASQTSAHTAQSKCANGELPESRITHASQTGVHS